MNTETVTRRRGTVNNATPEPLRQQTEQRVSRFASKVDKQYTAEDLYGGHAPKYRLVGIYGGAFLMNTIDTAITTTANNSNWDAITAMIPNNDDACVVYSEEYEAFSLAVRTPGGVAYAGFVHNGKGHPFIEEEMCIVKVRAIEDITIKDGDTAFTIPAGRELFKAVNEEYLGKLQMALPSEYVPKLQKVA